MKLTILSALLGLSFNVFAGPLNNLSQLPVLDEAKIEIQYGPALAAVQPTGYVRFKYVGCKDRHFEAQESEVDGVKLLKIVRTDKPGIDCMAVILKEARVQISSDMNANAHYVILNPLLPRPVN